MRNLIILCLISVAFGSIVGQDLYVTSVNGVNLRDSASIQSPVIRKLPFESKVLAIPNMDNFPTITIDNRPGRWVKVKHQEQEGFVFSAFLSPFKFTEIVDVEEAKEFQSNIYVLRFLDKYISDSILISIPTIESLPSVGGISYDFQVYSDGSTAYRHYGYESELLTIEFSKVDPDNLLNFFNYLNYRYNSQKMDYKRNVSFSLSNFPKAHYYVASATYSYIYSTGFIVQNNRVKILLDLGLGGPLNIWPNMTQQDTSSKWNSSILSDLDADGKEDEVRLFINPGFGRIYWAITNRKSVMPHRVILSTSSWFLQNRLSPGKNCWLQHEVIDEATPLSIRKIGPDGSLAQTLEKVKSKGKSIIFRCGPGTKRLLLYADEKGYHLGLIEE